MLASNIPVKMPTVWGTSAPGADIRNIPIASQIGIQAGAASFTDGFPPTCFIPVGAGGTPPFGSDFNGIMRQVTQWLRWAQAGGPVSYDSSFQTSVGGYPAGAIVQSATTTGLFWLSLTDNNTTNPDAGGAGWINPYPATGDTKWRPTSETLAGYVRMNALTVGNASSNSTERANVDAFALFSWVWTNFSNTLCPLLNSSGSPVSRGATALIDWNANSQITLPDMRGRGPFAMDTMGNSSAGRLTGLFSIGNASTPGSVGGEGAHTLLLTEIPAHNHTYSDTGHNHFTSNPAGDFIQALDFTTGTGNSFAAGGQGSADLRSHATGSTTINTITINNSGGGGTHNTLPPFMLGTWYLKL